MALFLLSYDLRNERDYQPLYDKLNEFKAVRVLESCWCFKRYNISSTGLRDFFKKFIDKDDGLWISQISVDANGPQWAGYNLDGNPNLL